MRFSRSLITAAACTALLVAAPATAFAAVSTLDSSVASVVGLDPAPSGLKVISTGNRTINVTWDMVPAATKYTVKVAVASNPDNIPNPALGTVTYVENNAKIAGLTNGVTYAISVAATVNAKLTDYSAPIYAAPTPGEVPSNLRLVEIGNGAAYLDFDGSGKATAYKGTITVVDAHGIANPLPGTAATSLPLSTLTATKLTNGVTYGFTVAALVDGQYTDPSARVLATPQAVPNKMGTPSFGTITGSSVQVKWAAGVIAGDATAIDKYTVFYKPTAATAWKSMSVAAPTLVATIDGLDTGVEYQFQTQATNSIGAGPKSVIVKTTPSNKPGAVLNLTANRTGAGSTVNLAWTPPTYTGGASITKYTLTVAPKAGTVDVASSVTTNKATVTGLDPATDYKFTLTPYTSAGAGAASIIGSYAQAPGVTGVMMSPAGVVTLSFTPVANQTVTYQAQARQVDRLGSGAKVKNLQAVTTVTADKVSCASGACTAIFNKFADDIDGEAWVFQVRSTDNINQYSSWASITPPAPAAVDSVVTAVQAGKAWSVKYTLDWASRTSASNFYSMTANGAPSTDGTVSLGQYPGEVTVNLMGLGGTTSGVLSLPSGPSYNEATGGTIVDVPNYNGSGQTWRVHTFLSGGTFHVTSNPNTFKVLVVGGGGSTGSRNGAPGGAVVESTGVLPIGSHDVVVGDGGRADIAQYGNASPGGTSSLLGVSALGGQAVAGNTGTSGDGGAGNNGANPGGAKYGNYGGPGGAGVHSDVSGIAGSWYGGGGGGGTGDGAVPNSGGPGGNGGGGIGVGSPGDHNGTAGRGGGGGGDFWAPGSGGSGVVIVAYQIG